jgi:hypothetical protein
MQNNHPERQKINQHSSRTSLHSTAAQQYLPSEQLQHRSLLQQQPADPDPFVSFEHQEGSVASVWCCDLVLLQPQPLVDLLHHRHRCLILFSVLQPVAVGIF